LFTTPHFDGYPAMLVRLAKIAPDALEELVIEAWLARACPAAGRARLEEQRPRG